MMAWDFAALGPDGIPGSGDESQIVTNSFGDVRGLELRVGPHVALHGRAEPRLRAHDHLPGLHRQRRTGLRHGHRTAADDGDRRRGQHAVRIGAARPSTRRSRRTRSPTATSSRSPTAVPSAMGNVGADVLADGAVASGDEPLNMAAVDGWTAWASWGGTSRSAPTAAGNLALAYQAYQDAHSGEWPTYDQAREFLMNGAIDCRQRHVRPGLRPRERRAHRADLAAGAQGLSVSPSKLTPGDWRRDGVSRLRACDSRGRLGPGDADGDQQRVPSGHRRRGARRVRAHEDGDVHRARWTPAKMSPYRFDRPDWLSPDLSAIDPGGHRPRCLPRPHAHRPDRPLGVSGARASATRSVLSSTTGPTWTTTASLWTDLNGNGYVDDPSYLGSEIQKGEYMRFTYAINQGPSTEVRVGNPRRQVARRPVLRAPAAHSGEQRHRHRRDELLEGTADTDLVELTTPGSFALASHASAEVRLTAPTLPPPWGSTRPRSASPTARRPPSCR